MTEQAASIERGRPRILRLLAFVVVPTLFVAFLAWGLLTTTKPRAVPATKAPDFSLPLLGSGQILSSRELKRSPVMVNFWASWCVPCREEAPDLERTWREYKDKGVRLLGVNIQDTEEDVLAFVKEFGLTYPSVRDV
ncbi:MAG: TlpA disulfide reductase family protein [Actinomycetota bacterium]